MTRWLRLLVVVLVLADTAVFALRMMDDPLFTSLQTAVNGVQIKTLQWWRWNQRWDTHQRRYPTGVNRF